MKIHKGFWKNSQRDLKIKIKKGKEGKTNIFIVKILIIREKKEIKIYYFHV